MNVAKHVARSSLLIEHLSPTNSRVSYSSLHGGISMAAAAAMATDGGDGDADGGGERGGRSTVTSAAWYSTVL